MHQMLNAIEGITCLEPQGAFYCFPSFAGVLGRDIRGHTPTTTLELADLILSEAKVAVVPGEAFGAPGYMRLSFALGDDDLAEGVTRIAQLLG
jgi:aspartate/methionine/tyrosine aminotransferase